MQKDVTQGKSYCLTVYSVPCKVTAIGKDNIEYTLLNVSETGQYLFIAPTWKVNISQDDASIVETFKPFLKVIISLKVLGAKKIFVEESFAKSDVSIAL